MEVGRKRSEYGRSASKTPLGPRPPTPRLPSVIRPGRMWSDDGTRSRHDAAPTVIRPDPNILRNAVEDRSVPGQHSSSSDRDPTLYDRLHFLIRPSSDRDRTRSDDVENPRPAVSSVPPPTVLRPSSDRLPSEDGRMRSGLATGRKTVGRGRADTLSSECVRASTSTRRPGRQR